MRVNVLGTVQVCSADGAVVEVGGVRLRMLVARLALEPGRAVSAEALVDGLWGEQGPAEAAGALQALVSRLRRALRGVGVVELVAGGYRLGAHEPGGLELDVDRFEELAGRGRHELAAGGFADAAATLDSALGLWRGNALADVRDAPFARDAATRLEGLRTAAIADRFDAGLRLGRYEEALPGLERAVADDPLSERLAALRIRALAGAGRQADALAAYEAIRGTLADELGIDPSAELREAHLALLRGELDRPRSRPEPGGVRLPAQLTTFVGRDGELRSLAAQLTEFRLVTVVGPGGVGKTRLALEAAARSGHEQVRFAPLAGVDAGQLPDAVIGAVNAVSGGPPAESAPIDRLAALLDIGTALLVLDNCEHLIQAVADLAQGLLDRLPALRILATSREPLAITGESLCHLGPLEIPRETVDFDVAAASAVRLFLDRAVAVRPDFVLDEHTRAPVIEICRRLDGIPLALELAAARLRAMGVEQIARRLDDRFRLLTSGDRTALPRQRTLSALVEWSWDLLTEPERILARRLAAFPGGADIVALESICADERLAADDIFYLMSGLVEKSLVQSTGGESPRYRMLETIRAYAAARLNESGENLGNRFTAYYLALAQRYEPLLRTDEQLRAIAVFDAEQENLVAALRAAEDPGLQTRFIAAMFWYWGIRGMSGRFETFVTAALRYDQPEPVHIALRVVLLMAGGPVVDSDATRTLLEGCLTGPALEFHPALPLWALLLAYRTGHPDLAAGLLDRAVAGPDRWVRASAHLMRDFALTETGEQPAGARARREALREFEIVGERWGLGLSLLATGRDQSLRGDHAGAIESFERAARVAVELGTEDDIAETRVAGQREWLRAGDFHSAARDIDTALTEATARGLPRLATAMLLSRVELQRRTGDPDGAEHTFESVRQRVRHLPFPEPIAADLIVAAHLSIHLARADIARARELLPPAARGAFAQGHAAALAQLAEQLAELHAVEADWHTAAFALGMSEIIRGRSDEGEPRLSALIADLTDRLGEPGFRAAYRRGADLARPDALDRLAELSGRGMHAVP